MMKPVKQKCYSLQKVFPLILIAIILFEITCVILFFEHYKNNHIRSLLLSEVKNASQHVFLHEDEMASNIILEQPEVLEVIFKDLSLATNMVAQFSSKIDLVGYKEVKMGNDLTYYYEIFRKNLGYQVVVPVRGLYQKLLGFAILKGRLDDSVISSLMNAYYVFLAINIFFMSFVALLVYYAFKKYLYKPLHDILAETRAACANQEELQVRKNKNYAIVEIDSIKSELYNIIDSMNKNAALVAIGKSSSMVAHDIRSPLAALTMVTSQLKEFPEEFRLLVQRAVQRIHDIANDLAGKKIKEGKFLEIQQQKNLDVYLLSSLIDPLISEKRLQYRSKININIEANIDKESYGLFAKIQPIEFKRILSNLINNAVEAMGNAGKVTVEIFSIEERIILKVYDNGKGILPEILPRLMQRGETHGKDNGSGLGLYNAKATVESWGGSILLESTVGKGTIVTITLLRDLEPDWFVPVLRLESNATVIILDDDESIHQVWRNRFDEMKFKRENIFHFSTVEDVRRWRMNAISPLKLDRKNETLFLFDYEFLGSKTNGLDLIEELQIVENAILVTSHFEDEDVRKHCKKLSVKLLPKNLAGFVPILVTKSADSRDVEFVLIDDKPIVRETWQIGAKIAGKKIATYSGVDEFMRDSEIINKDANIYIDSDLGGGDRGEVLSEKIYNKGFKQIYLTTGFGKKDFGKIPWITDVVDKDPPFLRR